MIANYGKILCSILYNLDIKEKIGIKLKQEKGQFLGTMQKENYFKNVWKFKRYIYQKDICYNNGENGFP